MPTETGTTHDDLTTATRPRPIEVLGSSTCEDTVLILDRFGAARVTSHAAEAGGLVDPSEAVEWLRFLALECSGEIEWPGDG